MAGRRIAWVLLLSPVLGALYAKSRPAEPAAGITSRPPHNLAFDQYLVNLRDAPLRPVLSADYRFSNIGEQPVTITELAPSCGCLTPQLAKEKRTYEPGERGAFRVQIATANESPGPQEYTVDVKYLDPDPQQVTVRFKVRLPERKISVEPAELAFFQYNGQPSERVIHVTDYRGPGLEVLDASSTSDLLSCSVQPADVDEAGRHRVPVRLSVPGEVPPGRQLVTVTIRTSDPEFSHIRVPVLIDGPASAGREIQPVNHEQPAP